MIKLILLIFALMICIYLVLLKIAKFKFIKNVSKKFLIIFFLITLFISLLIFRLISNYNIDGNYIPAEFDGKTLSPGKVESEKK